MSTLIFCHLCDQFKFKRVETLGVNVFDLNLSILFLIANMYTDKIDISQEFGWEVLFQSSPRLTPSRTWLTPSHSLQGGDRTAPGLY